MKTIEWNKKRLTIISRDGCVCQHCKLTETVYQKEPPHHFFFDGIDYEPVFDDSGSVVGSSTVFKLTPAPRAVILHVHHTYYFFDRNPWEYLDEALITLCSHCHHDFHKKNVVEWFAADGNSKKLTPCPRCDGAGGFAKFSHIQGGECFYCRGAQYLEFMK